MKVLLTIFFLSVYSFSFAYTPTIKFSNKNFFLKERRETIYNNFVKNFLEVHKIIKCIEQSNSFLEEEVCLGTSILSNIKDDGFENHKKEVLEAFSPIIYIEGNLKKCLSLSMTFEDMNNCKVLGEKRLTDYFKSIR